MFRSHRTCRKMTSHPSEKCGRVEKCRLPLVIPQWAGDLHSNEELEWGRNVARTQIVSKCE